MSGRGATTLATLGAALHAALQGPRPAWVSDATAAHLRAGLDGLQADAHRALANIPDRVRGGAPVLGVGTNTLTRWLAAGGWLRRDRPELQS